MCGDRAHVHGTPEHDLRRHALFDKATHLVGKPQAKDPHAAVFRIGTARIDPALLRHFGRRRHPNGRGGDHALEVRVLGE